MTHKISSDQLREAINKYGTISSVANYFNIPYRTVDARCKRLGLVVSQRRTIDWMLIQQLLNQHISTDEICETFNITKASLSAGLQRKKVTYPDNYWKLQQVRKIGVGKLATIPTKYDWKFLQEEYDKGLSCSDLTEHYNVCHGSMQLAKNRGDFKPRTHKEAIANLQTHHPERLVRSHSDTSKQKVRDSINKRYEDGWMPKAGRCKKFDYSSPTAGNVKLDGTWELKVARWLDSIEIDWARNKVRFPYIGLNGENRTYTPDFYIPTLDLYIEVKGYETELDRQKWKYFPYSLVVWKKDMIESLTDGNSSRLLDNAC